jgi:holo-[acyl-carrier protein] synthase
MIFIGNDIVEVAKIKRFITEYNDIFLNKVFTQNEQEFCLKRVNPYIHFAGRFAGKEAIKKILLQLNDGPIPLKNIEIKRELNCPPKVFIKNEIYEDINISISHTDNYATAVAILNKK